MANENKNEALENGINEIQEVQGYDYYPTQCCGNCHRDEEPESSTGEKVATAGLYTLAATGALLLGLKVKDWVKDKFAGDDEDEEEDDEPKRKKSKKVKKSKKAKKHHLKKGKKHTQDEDDEDIEDAEYRECDDDEDEEDDEEN